PGPFPVIRIAAELTYAFGRSAYQPYIGVTLILKENKLVALKKGAGAGFQALFRVGISTVDFIEQLRLLCCARRTAKALQHGHNFAGHVYNLHQKLYT